MKKYINFESRVVTLPLNNIDTDQIIPARFLKTTSKQGLDAHLFHDWRYDVQGNQMCIRDRLTRARKSSASPAWPSAWRVRAAGK